MRDGPDFEFFALQGALLGRYSLDREIGRGGMGIVYLAHEVELDRPVALKLLPPQMAAQPTLRERFLREARTAAKLSHPNVVPIYAVDEVDEFVFFAMAYIDGGTLGERIRGRGPLTSKEAVNMLREVAWALAYSHAEGVVHRDVKPDNILLEKGSGRALVTDFGIAHVGTEPGMTAAGEVLGTAEFMSPEQASGDEVDPRSDIYALGVVGFYALTGGFPFEGTTAAALLAQHLTKPAPPVASVAPEVPAVLAKAVDRCLRKSPEDRFADGAALAEAMGEGSESEREVPVPVRVYNKKVRELGDGVAAIVVLWLMSPLVYGTLWAIVGDFAAEGLPIWLLWLIGVVYGVTTLGVTIQPIGALGRHTRKLLESGFALEDVRLGLSQEVSRNNEEIHFEYGKEITRVDRALSRISWAGLATAVVAGGVGLAIGGSGALGFTALAAFEVTLLSGIFAAYRNKHRRDAMGEGWLSIFRSRAGKWLFKLGGLGLGRRQISSGGAHRPTEMAIGIAADRLFEQLPKTTKQDLSELPETIRKLEGDAQRMRQHVDEMNGLLAEIGDDPRGVGVDERTKLRADLEARRDEAQRKMTDAVSALETIRLGLLRMHAGGGSVESLTQDLGSAQALSETIEHLLDGQLSIDELLGIAGRSQASQTPTPTPTPA